MLHRFASEVTLPRWLPVRQRLQLPRVESIPPALAAQLDREEIRSRIRPGMRVAVAVGSRGVANIAEIVQLLVQRLKGWGAEPFIVPAMGSHAGGTAEHQAAYIRGLGIDPETHGIPIRATMDTAPIGTTPQGMTVAIDRYALQADAVIPVCRIKPHTSFRGPPESGAIKMLTIGLGNQVGAESLHVRGFDGFDQVLRDAAAIVLDTIEVPLAICTVENAADETAVIEAIPGQQLQQREAELLQLARRLIGRLLVPRLDVLVVGRLGKDISGLGMDPNVTGRFSNPRISGGAQVNKLAVLDVSDASHGNTLGMGLADITTARVVEQVDWAAVYVNVITSTVFGGAKLPLCAASDRDAIALAARCCNRPAVEAHLAYIASTMELERIFLSEPLWQQHRDDGLFEPLADPGPIPFDDQGNLLARFPD